ncbi:unnamed protein product [Linum tenue]|uniref:Xaa-Pro aminopeptidase n=1 Tax=Linum tenue TaxID=586396 RepID=A0AAV0KE50_9ROSI|nr:unnamed protein product [Linum tenue]
MAEILSSLRSLMAAHSPPLDALVVPSEDYHQSEYVSARDTRREFVSGFTGSAGLALITKDEARLWTDGRYFLQAEQQLSNEWTLMRMAEDPAVDVWMAENLPEEAAVGVNPWCISADTAHRWESAFAKKKQKLVQTATDIVDEIWKNRPADEANPVVVQPLEFTGCSVAEKLHDLRGKLKASKARGIIITTLDQVAWLFNIRGSDVPYCPVVHAFALVTLNSAFLYVDRRKVSSEVNSYMEENAIEVRDYTAVSSDVALLASDQLDSTSTINRKPKAETVRNGTTEAEGAGVDLVWVDSSSCSYALYSKLNLEKVFQQQSPLALAKALKNPVELDGLRKSHIRDGAAVVQYLVWLDKQMQDIYGASGYFLEGETDKKKKDLRTTKLTEVTVSDKLESFRASKEHFRGLSFPTISSVGPNAAIIHYGPQPETCAEVDPDKIYLFDSGAQYLDGTTDITRTVHFGVPSTHEKACYTAVLKGHIGLGNARFPNGTNGHTLDILARIPLWKSGLDYRHGTGHGIGSFLFVHEGPHLISFRPSARNVPIQASMTVTDVPEEIEWLNTYHSRCSEILAPYLNENERSWLSKATEPVTVA